MMYRVSKRKTAVLVALAGALVPATAAAHIEISSGAATADATSVVTFSVGHGCEGNDTFRVTIDIPEGVTSVRPMRSDFGTPSVVKDATGTNVTSVTWQKPDTEAQDADVSYYELKLRLKAPDQPFTRMYFAAHQTCRAADGTLTTVEWTDLPTTPPEMQTDHPAAELAVMPARMPGWNKYTVPVAMTDLAAIFPDALIVWKGTAAFSANANTTELIGGTAGVTALTELAAGDEIWVKY